MGCILAERGDDGADPEPSTSDMELMLANGFKIAHLPRPNFAVVAEFPFKTTLSIYLAIMRVYPRLKAYISSNGLCAYPAVEVYTGDVIHVSWRSFE